MANNNLFYPTPVNPYTWNNNFTPGTSYVPQTGGYMAGNQTSNHPGGYDTTYINDVISSLRSSGSAQENIDVINCYVGRVNCLSKINDYFNNVSYENEFNASVSSDVTAATIRTINCNKVENSNIFGN